MKFSRRNFLEISGLALGALSLRTAVAEAQNEMVAIVADPADEVAASPACSWARMELSRVLAEHSLKVAEFASVQEAPRNAFCVVSSATGGTLGSGRLKSTSLTLPREPQSLALIPFSAEKRHGILACGDVRGLMYALLELADRVRHSEHALSALEQRQAIVERPSNSFRSIGRIFCSDIQDKPWFYDRDMWPAYFSMLATQRFNRFSLNFGIGYDVLDNVREAYFLCTYPFLLAVPGYNVRAVPLPDEERDRNLEMLHFISAQAVAHGIDFQLGIWTHGYHWGPASKPNYTIEGITPQNHAAYSRDALTTLLKVCPNISGITLRTHGESGIREGSYAFWSTVFAALPASGRKVSLDLHTKGLDQQLIEAAVQTGVPVTLSPKFWAEHMGLPYQQGAIRELEMPHEEHKSQDFFSLSSGSRSFTRYGYADFLREGRPYKVMFRIWPGSHRLLLWGDPLSAAAYARAFQFCGSDGVELFEPLSFKGRRDSGIAGSRCAYADASLEPHWDWQKYLYTYRAWGRLIYNPDAAPDVWRRYLRKQFGAAAPAVEGALDSASVITPLITTAHLPSAANEAFNPEYYTNQSITDAPKPTPYFDTPVPKVFGNVSPLDPQLFSTINQFVAELRKKELSAKYSPLEVAEWLDAAAGSADSHLRDGEAHAAGSSPEFRRAAVDIRIQIGIGRFFAAKFRSGVLYAAFEQSGDRSTLEEAIKQYRRARGIWQDFAEAAKGVYVSDITFGPSPFQRGSWLDRLPAIDEDIAEMQKRLETAPATREPQSSIPLRELTSAARRESVAIQHAPAANFVPAQPLEIAVSIPRNAAQSLAIRLYYRHVNQAERYELAEMRADGNRFTAVIHANYTNSSYPLQYYFELRRLPKSAWLFPGLGSDLKGQPYFVVRPALRS